MGGFTYETRKKLTEQRILEAKAAGKDLTGMEKKLLPDPYYSVKTEPLQWMTSLLENGEAGTLSEIYKRELPGLVRVCVPEGQEEEFYYALDQMNQFQMTAGWYRRSLRTKEYIPFVRQSVSLLWAYSQLKFYKASLAEILTGKTDPEIYDHARTESWPYAGILAAQIDLGREEMVRAVREILYGENNTAMLSHEMIRGIVMSRDTGLYKVLGDFLLAARLQEGARQAVCETMDAGRPEAFLSLFQVIEDHDLIRFSSVKRAVGTWIGIFDENSADRISNKLLHLMGKCLREPEFCEEQLRSNDSVAISCALWAKGFYDAGAGVEAVLELIKNGTKNQKLTASYFNRSLQDQRLSARAAREVFLTYPEDLELMACYLPGFMGSLYSIMSDLVWGKRTGWFSVEREEASEPEKLPVTAYGLFENEEEARKIYGIFKNAMERIPKKGLDLDPCIFPWYRVTMSRSDLAARMCVIAWMLQDETYLDEAAALIPVVGQGQVYGASRAMTARLLLYRPRSRARRDILFELLHNPEEYTVSSAFCLAKALEDLDDRDYRKLEANLKYKKGRTETLSLLRRQSPERLRECVARLLGEKSEECHMGALDLALGMKKDAPEAFEVLRPALAAFQNPTGREQVLLAQLTGKDGDGEDILKKPGYGFYDTKKEFVLPEIKTDIKKAPELFSYGEKECIRVLKALNSLVEANQFKEYTTVWGEEKTLGAEFGRCRWRNAEDPEMGPLDEYPFREMWEEFYRKEIRSTRLLTELYLYQACRQRKGDYRKNTELYKKVFGKGLLKKPPFTELVEGLRFGAQARTVIDCLFFQYVPREELVSSALPAVGKLVSVLNDENESYEVQESRWNGEVERVWKRSADLPVFAELISWLGMAGEEDWGTAFALRFQLKARYDKRSGDRALAGYQSRKNSFLELSDLVQCYVRGIWDKDLFYKAVFEFLGIGSLLSPISLVEQKGAVAGRDARSGDLDRFFGRGKIRPEDGKYRFDTIGEEMPEMTLAHTLYKEIVPAVLQVELKRGEQETPFSSSIGSIRVVYGIPVLVQILTALGKDTLERSQYSYYSGGSSRRSVLSHLLKVCRPAPEETAADLGRALQGTDITKKRLVEMAMYAEQWIPMVEEYLNLPGFKSGCYYFMAHTSEWMDEYARSVIARYTPLSPEELRDGAFDIHWFFEAYEKLGEENFKLLYDAAKYSSSGTAHGRARKYADAALGNTRYEALVQEIREKRNKDLLMSLGLLPLPQDRAEKDKILFERYRFIQEFKKESRRFGAQRRASEGRAAELALRNLSSNAGFSDVTRLVLRMEAHLAEESRALFEGDVLEDGTKIRLFVDEDGKSSIVCEKGGKTLKSVPSRFKKNETVLRYQEVHKQLKDQYSRTRQMMEQAMEDRTVFEAWEILELQSNPVAGPIVTPLVLLRADQADREAGLSGEQQEAALGLLTREGLVDWTGTITPVQEDTGFLIAHPWDLYEKGCWHQYQRLLFEKQIRQPFKQVFRELYVKLEEELEKTESAMFAGNQIQPKKTAGTLRTRRWVADYEDGLQKVYYRENIVARIYAMADWFSPSDIEAPTLEAVVFYDRKSMKPLRIREIPDVIYSEVMRDVDLAVSTAHAGGVDPETSRSTVEMRSAIIQCSLELFRLKNVRLEKTHAFIDGKLGQYTVHLGSGVVHQMGNAMVFVVPVHSQHRGRIFLPFVDDDPKTAEILSKILLFAEDDRIKDPGILSQIR